MDLMQKGKLSQGMQDRMRRGSRMPGWVKIDSFDWYETLK